MASTEQKLTSDGILEAYKGFFLPANYDNPAAVRKWANDVFLDAFGGKTVDMQTQEGLQRAYILAKGEQPRARAIGEYARVKVGYGPGELLEVQVVVGANSRHDIRRISLSQIERIAEVSDTPETVEEDANKAELGTKVKNAFNLYSSTLLSGYRQAALELENKVNDRKANDQSLQRAEGIFSRTQDATAGMYIRDILKPEAARLAEAEAKYQDQVNEATAQIRAYAKELLSAIKGIPLRIATAQGMYNVTLDGNASIYTPHENGTRLFIMPKNGQVRDGFFPIALDSIVDVTILKVPEERRRDMSGERRAFNEQLDRELQEASKRVKAQKQRPTIVSAGSKI